MPDKRLEFNPADIERTAYNMAGKKQNVPADETDAQKLVRLSNIRVNKAINAIRGISNLGGYKPTKEQTDKAFTALRNELTVAMDAWSKQKAAKPTGFSL